MSPLRLRTRISVKGNPVFDASCSNESSVAQIAPNSLTSHKLFTPANHILTAVVVKLGNAAVDGHALYVALSGIWRRLIDVDAVP